MTEFDVLKYKPVIQDILKKMKVRKDQREDMEQDFYVALLEKREALLSADNDMNYAAGVCRNVAIRAWLKNTFQDINASSKENPRKIWTDSLSDPKTKRRALKIISPEENPINNIFDEQLKKLVDKLPEQEYNVIYRLFVQGKTRKQTAEELGVSVTIVSRRSKRGIELLRELIGE